MKKILLSSFIGLLVLTVTGCDFGKKGTVICSMEPVNGLEETIGEMPKQEITIDYQGKKIKNASVTYIFTTNEIAKEKYDDLLEEAKNNNWSTNFKLEGNKITNISNKDEIIELAISNNENKDNKSKNTVIDGLKAQGYTCK